MAHNWQVEIADVFMGYNQVRLVKAVKMVKIFRVPLAPSPLKAISWKTLVFSARVLLVEKNYLLPSVLTDGT
jgi:hypothetical protein